jgi:hypothetical protein
MGKAVATGDLTPATPLDCPLPYGDAQSASLAKGD